MDFNGFASMDFDFFKRKDRMSNEEYEKNRNDVKLHFRSLCYEMQKMYHKKTGGVLELDKDFQSFNRRSNSIFAERAIGDGSFRIRIQMNSNGVAVETYIQLCEHITPKNMAALLIENKNLIWNHTMSSKNMVVYCELMPKNGKPELFRLSSAEINKKSYESFSQDVSIRLEECKGARLAVGYAYSKDECIKQGKTFQNAAYSSLIEVMKLGAEMK